MSDQWTESTITTAIMDNSTSENDGGLIFLVGVVGNASLIWILLGNKAMRSVPNTYIFNLAVGDLLVLLCSVPFTSTVFTLDSWPYGLFICKASEFAKDTSVGVSVFTLTALSLDRYSAIVRPLQSYVSGLKSKRMILSLTIIWLMSLALALPASIYSHLFHHQISEKINGTTTIKEIIICYPFPEEFGEIYPKLVVLIRALVHYFLPLLTIGTFYAIMARHLLRSGENIPGQAEVTSIRSYSRQDQSISSNNMKSRGLQQEQHQLSQTRSRHQLAKMILSFVLLFALCFLPMHVYFLWFYFDPNSRENYNSFAHALKIIGFCLAYINSCINPIALYCMSTTFRKHFNLLLCCCCPAFRQSEVIEPVKNYSQYSNSHRSVDLSFKTIYSSAVGIGGSLSARRLQPSSNHGEVIPLHEYT